MADPCLFCGTSGIELTNEHVNPQWLLKHLNLPADDLLFQGVAYSATGRLAQAPRIHSSYNFVQGHICTDCNSGWMCRLESAAKPVLVDLIDNKRSLALLTAAEATIVGRWAAKTAYLHSWTSPMKRPVQIEHLRVLHGDIGKPYEGVCVFARQDEYRQPSSYVQTWHWPQYEKPITKPSGETPDEAYKLGMQFRHLYLLVAFWPTKPSELMLVKNLHLPVYPPAPMEWLTYEIDLVVGPNEVDRIAVFSNWLGVSHVEPRPVAGHG